MILVTLAAKLALLAWRAHERPQGFTYIDTGTYVRPALALLRTGSFSPSPERAPEPEINRTPGYPLLVAGVYAVFGERPLLLSVLGVLFSAGTALVLLALANELSGARAAFFAVLVLSLDAGTFLRSPDQLSDTPFTFFLTLGLALAVAALGDGRGTPRRAALSGLALGAATLVRPISIVLLPLVALALLAARSPRRLARAAAFALPCVLLVGGWSARNAIRAGAFTITPLAGSQPLFYFASAVEARAEHVTIPEEQERLGNPERWFRSGGATEREAFGERRYADVHPETARLSLVELSRRWRRRALTIVAAHPFVTAKVFVLFVRDLLLAPTALLFGFQQGFYFPRPEISTLYFDRDATALFSALLREHPGVFAASLLCILELLVTYALFVRGVAAAGPWNARHALLLAALLALVVVSAGTEAGDDRFRLPLMPLVALYAGLGLAALRRPVTIRST